MWFKKKKELRITFVLPPASVEKAKNELFPNQKYVTHDMIADSLMAHLSSEIIEFFNFNPKENYHERLN